MIEEQCTYEKICGNCSYCTHRINTLGKKKAVRCPKDQSKCEFFSEM